MNSQPWKEEVKHFKQMQHKGRQSRDTQNFLGSQKIMWTSALCFIKLIPEWGQWIGKCTTWISPTLGNSPKPSLPISALQSVFLSIETPHPELLPDSLEWQASPASPTGNAAWMQIKTSPGRSGWDSWCWAQAMYNPSVATKPFWDLYLHHYSPFQKEKLELFVHDVKDMSISPLFT